MAPDHIGELKKWANDLALAKDEVEITGDCLKLSKRGDTPAFETPLVKLPDH